MHFTNAFDNEVTRFETNIAFKMHLIVTMAGNLQNMRSDRRLIL